MGISHEFFSSLLTEKGFKAEDNSFTFMWLRYNMFEPDYGNPGAASFFNCNGATLIINSTVDKSGLVKIEKAALVFDMQSPRMDSGEIAVYQLIYPVEAGVITNMLVNNTDVRI